VENKSFHSFWRSAKKKINALTLFREVKSDIKMLRDQDEEVKILDNSSRFSRNEIFQQNYFVKAKRIVEIDGLLVIIAIFIIYQAKRSESS